MKPLVPGCKALITKGMYAGTEVTCINFVGTPTEVFYSVHDDCWEISKQMQWTLGYPLLDPKVIEMPYCPAKYLMRIDGGTEEEVLDSQHEESVA